MLRNFISSICVILILFICQSLTPAAEKENERNLKVLPKSISDDELKSTMKTISKSLGVKCNHCHAQQKDNPDKLDFASDAKPEKEIARKMFKMTADINKKYIIKISKGDEITCVTCHNGHVHPNASVDSLSTK
jgi:hypothetical protein